MAKYRGHIQLINNYLYFANDGKPFSRKGVLAITNPNLSDKTHNKFDEPVDQYEHIKNEKEWIKKIRESALDGYELDNNRIITDRKREEGSLKDYAGRWIFEILQNMDDAMLSDEKKFIGTKGLGFLSILEVGNTPEIFSSQFSFKFDKNLTSEAFKKIGLSEKFYQKPPSFTIPHDTERDQVVESLLKQDFTTVIKLKVKDETSKLKIIEDLENLDFNFIILSQIMNSLSIIIEDSYKIRIEKKNKNLSNKDNFSKNKVEVKLIDFLNESQKIFHWVTWGYEWQSSIINKQNSSCILAVPFKGKEPDLDCSTRQIYNFYPTDKTLDTPLLLHITFNLSQNRKELLQWGDEKDWNSEDYDNENKVLIEHLRSLMEKIVFDDFFKPEHIFRIASGLNDLGIEVSTVEEKIHQEIYDVVSNSCFVPIYGKKFITPAEINSWEDNLPYCFEEDEIIANYNLPIKEINEIASLYKNFSDKKIKSFLDIFSECKLKSSNREERFESLSLLLKTFDDDYLKLPFNNWEKLDQIFLKQKIFLDDKKEIICLSDGPFFLKKMNKVPSCIIKKQFSAESTKLVNDQIFNNDETAHAVKTLFKKYIFKEYDDILFFLPILLNKWNNEDNNSNKISSWNEYGFEVLKYLFNIYHKNKEIDFDKLNKFIKLPTRQHKYWNNPYEIYLSKDWGISKSLEFYLKDQKKTLQPSEFILNKKDFSKAIDIKNLEETELSSFIKKLGVLHAPGLYDDGTFKHLEDEYFIKDKERLLTFEIMLDSFLESSLVVNGSGALQLMSLKIIEFEDSVFYPDRFISIEDIYIDEEIERETYYQDINNIIPIFNSQKLKNKIGDRLYEKILKLITSNMLLSIYDIRNSLSGEKFEDFINKTLEKIKETDEESNETVDENYKTQIKIFTKIIEESLDVENLNYYPCHKINNTNNSIIFKSEKIIFNDTELFQEDICSMSHLEQYGLYIRKKTRFQANNETTFLLSDLIDIKPKYVEVSKDFQTDIIEMFNEKKDFIAFIGKIKADELLEELKSMTLCQDLELLTTSKTLDNSIDNKKTYKVKHYFNGQKFFVKFDQNKDELDQADNIIFLLCKNCLKKQTSFSIIKNIFNAKDSNAVKNVFENNGYDFQDFQDKQEIQFKKIYKKKSTISKTNTENSLVDNDHQQNTDDLKINIDNKNENIEGDKNNFIKNKLDINDKIKNNTSTPIQNEQIDDKNKLEKNYKSNEKRNQTNYKFGRRLSGHIRANNPQKEVNVRKYFDDEHESNKEIGEKGERIIFEILKKKYGEENVQHLGGNNKGYDIEYKENEQTYFVEVKSLQGSWDDNDIILSRAQFEKAQKEKELFILYIIEFLGSSEKQEITPIENPIRFFSKLQLDHGWKNFKSNSNENPTINDFILYEDKKYKIEKIKKIGSGSKIRLFFKNHDPLIFNKNTMKVISE